MGLEGNISRTLGANKCQSEKEMLTLFLSDLLREQTLLEGDTA